MALLERDELLVELGNCLADTRHGRGRLVLVSGEAGIGKSTLLDAFEAHLPRATRVLRGSCDPVVPARPFAPIFDIANQVHSGLHAALQTGDRDRVCERFLATLREQGAGGIVVLEDLHWADSATLDLLRVVGRRLPDTPVMVIGTYRGHDVDGEHPLRQALGDIPPGVITNLSVPPLSLAGVSSLAVGTAIAAGQLHEATGGNPFFITEIIASGGGALPSTVHNAVSARVARLSGEAQDVLRAVAVLGTRVERPMVPAVVEGVAASSGLEEALTRGMLVDQDGLLSFRHELARRAVLDALAPSVRGRLHARALVALRTGIVAADAVRLVQHAIEAGDSQSIVELAPQAAEQAARLGAYGEAADYLAIALALPAEFDERARAEMLERYAYACSMSDRVAAARTAQLAALDVWRRLGERIREGDGLRALAMFMWHAGEGDRAREVALDAVRTLEPITPHGHELAQAYAKVAQLVLNSGQDDAAARRWAQQAMDLANHIGDEPVAVHAMTTLALAEIYPNELSGVGLLDDALARARAASLHEDTMRILINLVETAHDLKRYDLADRYVMESIAFLRDHEFDLYRHILHARMAQLALERGRWDEAETEARALLAGTTRANQARVRALEVLGRLGARRGQVDPWIHLDEGLATVGHGELQDVCPLLAARAEAAWLERDSAKAAEAARAGLALAVTTGAAFWYSELSFWAWRTGSIEQLPNGTAEAYAQHAAGEHRAAAESWARIGCPYEQADALSDSDDETDLRDALDLLQGLGGMALAGRVTQKLRAIGANQIPRGPRATTRANPAGLSTREKEVLALVCCGLRNAEIAQRLVVAPKTVDHHVSAVLRKLGVPDREAARREAHRLGLQDGEQAAPK